MKKIYFEAIQRGDKTTTLRYWQSPRVKPGALHSVPGLGKVCIEAVRVVEPDELTQADAQADGFASLAALKSALRKLYTPQQRRQRRLYQVRFTLLPTAPDHHPAEAPAIRRRGAGGGAS